MRERGPQLIVAAVDKDLVKRVVGSATRAGATAVTHWRGHGSGVEHETFMDVLLRFEPERELVGVVVDGAIADDVFDAIEACIPAHRRGEGFVAMSGLARASGNVLRPSREPRGQ